MVPSRRQKFVCDVLVVGGGHAGAEAAWAAAASGADVVMLTMDPQRIGVMSCNPAIGGLAKGQIVREIDALGGLMGVAADDTGIQFRVLNQTKGPAVHGPRCQSDKYAYARTVQRLLRERSNIRIVPGQAADLLVEGDRCRGVLAADERGESIARITAAATVLTTGTFMRGLMHSGEDRVPGGRVGEAAAVPISAALARLGFELGRLKTGTPPRLDADTIDFASLEIQSGDDPPQPFSDLTDPCGFPRLEQRPCWLTQTGPEIHDCIRANLDRAPMYNGQIARENVGPRYCPSIEDKVVRFADRTSHHVFLEPESLDTPEIYCNGISTSLPQDVQDFVVHHLPGCQDARVIRYGYAVEYDMVWPHQIDATGMTKRVEGLYLAGQINGTSGYEEAAGQGLLTGVNAARTAAGRSPVRLRRDQAYIGVMMDDLVTKTPREPYRMFTSRAEFRLLLRADNADERLTPLGRDWGLVDDGRWARFERRQESRFTLRRYLDDVIHEGQRLAQWIRRPEVDEAWLRRRLEGNTAAALAEDRRIVGKVLADLKYEGYIGRQQQQVEQMTADEAMQLPEGMDFAGIGGLRGEAQQVLDRFRPATLGQAARLAGINPSDVMILRVAIRTGASRRAG